MRDPQYISGFLPIGLALFLLMMAFAFRRRSKEAGSDVAWRELAMPAMVMVLIFVPLAVLEALFGPFWNSHRGAIAFALGSVLFGTSIVRGLARRRRAAGLLFQVGHPPPPWRFLWPLIGLGVLVLLGLLWLQWQGGTAFSFWWTTFIVTSTAASLLSVRGGLQLRNGGVLWGFLLLPWEDVESYELDDAHGTVTLRLRKASFWNPSARYTFNVPWVDQDEVMSILNRRVQVKTTSIP